MIGILSFGRSLPFTFFLLLSFFSQPSLSLISRDNAKMENHEIVHGEYIVSLHDFISFEEHRSYIQRSLNGNLVGWEIVERHNTASHLPSDFVVLRIDPTHQDIIEKLKKSSLIKHVFPQKRYTRSPNAFIEQDTFLDTIIHTTNQTCSQKGLLKHGRNVGKFFVDETGADFRRRKLHATPQVTHLLNADFFWDLGITGEGVRVAIFDTGLAFDHPHFLNVKERTDWTDESTLEDYVGHGTFVAGVIASIDHFCTGFAPDSDLFIFRVFTNSQASYTSWFLDAFNYAIHCKVDVLNLSIGGPDWKDEPFVEKVWELSANGVIVVSAIGNEGPLFGTVNNPADMMDVLGVGGIDFSDNLAKFSSRGMTTWELPNGYGRVKPDVVGYGKSVSGSKFYEGCRTMSGTSVASPVVAGAVTLLISSVPELDRPNLVNPASIKQMLVETSELIPSSSIFEQGFGKINLVAAYELLSHYQPRASVIPSSLDLTECPYLWPFCTQPLYHTALPITFNATILNGMGVTGMMSDPEWAAGEGGEFLEIGFSYSDILWPWTGFLAIHIQVHGNGSSYRGIAEGIIRFSVTSPPNGRMGESLPRTTSIELPLRVNIIPTPPSSKRLLWDQFHSISYPLGFFPNDMISLTDSSLTFDWNGDHLHTNFKDFFTMVLSLGYYIEILGNPLTCFDAENYAALIIADPEDDFAFDEREKLHDDIANGLSLIVLADWYNEAIIREIAFFDENTEKTWTPYTGGANIPAINELLDLYGIAFGNQVYEGNFELHGKTSRYASGSSIIRFPKDGEVFFAELNDETSNMLTSERRSKDVAILGLFSTANGAAPDGGNVAVFGDSSCFDGEMKGNGCLWLLQDLLYYTTAEDNALLDYTTTLAKPLLYQEDKEWKAKRRAHLDPFESFTRITEDLDCSSYHFEVPTNIRDDPVDVLWQPLMYLDLEVPVRPPTIDPFPIVLQNLEEYVMLYILCFCVVIFITILLCRRRTKQTQLWLA